MFQTRRKAGVGSASSEGAGIITRGWGGALTRGGRDGALIGWPTYISGGVGRALRARGGTQVL